MHRAVWTHLCRYKPHVCIAHMHGHTRTWIHNHTVVMLQHASEDHVKTSEGCKGPSCRGRVGQSGGMPVPCLFLTLPLLQSHSPYKITPLREPLTTAQVHSTLDKNVLCRRQEKILGEILWLLPCGPDPAALPVSPALQLSPLGSWLVGVTVPGMGLLPQSLLIDGNGSTQKQDPEMQPAGCTVPGRQMVELLGRGMGRAAGGHGSGRLCLRRGAPAEDAMHQS